MEIFQSAYRPQRTVKTDLVRVPNDILRTLDSKRGVLLDLSAAIDIVDHSLLIDRLAAVGVHGTLLKWFSSYLVGREQQVIVIGHLSSLKPYFLCTFGRIYFVQKNVHF